MPSTGVDTLINQALELNKFKVYDVGDDMKFVRPSRGQTLQLTYFQNNILHLIALPALIANILIRNGHIFREDVIANTRSLFYFLKHELFVPVEEDELDALIIKYIDVFVQGGYIVELDNKMLTLSGDGFEELLILSSSIRLNLVRYLIAVTILKQMNDGAINKKEFIQYCVDLCKQVPSDVTNNSPEFADPIMFDIMCDTFVRHNYFIYLDDDTIKPHRTKVNKLSRAAQPLLAAKLVKHLKREIAQIKIASLKEALLDKAHNKALAAAAAAQAAAAAATANSTSASPDASASTSAASNSASAGAGAANGDSAGAGADAEAEAKESKS